MLTHLTYKRGYLKNCPLAGSSGTQKWFFNEVALNNVLFLRVLDRKLTINFHFLISHPQHDLGTSGMDS